MKNKISSFSMLFVIAIVAFFSLVTGCEKNNTPEALVIQKQVVKSEEYYTNLRAYKKSDHAIAFGWFGSAGGSSSNGLKFTGIPDSVDIVSLWGGYPDDKGWADLHNVQTIKGTKFVKVVFSENKLIGDLPRTPEGIKTLAKQIADEVDLYGLDGFDIDHEPHVSGNFPAWSFFGDPVNMTLFLKELSVYFGPKSGGGKLLIVDGEINELSADAFQYLDYAVGQAYYTSSPSNLQNRYNDLANCPTKKFVVTEDFERYWASGGVSYADPIRGSIPSLLGMAYWNPVQGRKGGMGAYHIEYEFPSDPDYKYLRQAIQIQNPAVK